jgi:hypothetical protein
MLRVAILRWSWKASWIREHLSRDQKEDSYLPENIASGE